MRPRDIYSIYNIKTLWSEMKITMYFSDFFSPTGLVRVQWAWLWALIIHHAEGSPEYALTSQKYIFFLFQQSLMIQNFLSWPNSHNRKQLSQEKSSCDSRRGQKNAKSSTLASIIMQRTNRFGAQTDKSVVSHWCDKNVRLDIKRKARPHAGPPAHLLWVPLLHCSFWNNTDRIKKCVIERI